VGLVIAKVGGSLYDLPDLAVRLRSWARTVEGSLLLVPGGGGTADVIRRLDRLHGIGEDAAHWLALRILSVNAHFLAGLVRAPVWSDVPGPASAVAVLDPYAFCQADEGRPGALPHVWDATSDSVAARAAEVAQGRLVLLKSVDWPDGKNWRDGPAAGLVDAVFPTIVARARIPVQWVNLRTYPPRPR
jgi:5-(aminomethyl)-3-furanmethanol phosphate kinase